MVQKGILIYAKSWQMVDEKTGANRQGISIEYLACEDLKPVVNEDGSMGVRHCKESVPLTMRDSIIKVPGLYDLEFGMKPGSRGKMDVKIVGLNYIGDVLPVPDKVAK